jgi:phage-related protein
MTGGGVNGAAPILGATGPGGQILHDGTSWISGWSNSLSVNNLSIQHPLGKRVLNPACHAINAANIFTTAFIGKTASTFSCLQPSAGFTQVTFNAITGANTGAPTSGTAEVVITFQVES